MALFNTNLNILNYFKTPSKQTAGYSSLTSGTPKSADSSSCFENLKNSDGTPVKTVKNRTETSVCLFSPDNEKRHKLKVSFTPESTSTSNSSNRTNGLPGVLVLKKNKSKRIKYTIHGEFKFDGSKITVLKGGHITVDVLNKGKILGLTPRKSKSFSMTKLLDKKTKLNFDFLSEQDLKTDSLKDKFKALDFIENSSESCVSSPEPSVSLYKPKIGDLEFNELEGSQQHNKIPNLLSGSDVIGSILFDDTDSNFSTDSNFADDESSEFEEDSEFEEHSTLLAEKERTASGLGDLSSFNDQGTENMKGLDLNSSILNDSLSVTSFESESISSDPKYQLVDKKDTASSNSQQAFGLSFLLGDLYPTTKTGVLRTIKEGHEENEDRRRSKILSPSKTQLAIESKTIDTWSVNKYQNPAGSSSAFSSIDKKHLSKGSVLTTYKSADSKLSAAIGQTTENIYHLDQRFSRYEENLSERRPSISDKSEDSELSDSNKHRLDYDQQPSESLYNVSSTDEEREFKPDSEVLDEPFIDQNEELVASSDTDSETSLNQDLEKCFFFVMSNSSTENLMRSLSSLQDAVNKLPIDHKFTDATVDKLDLFETIKKNILNLDAKDISFDFIRIFLETYESCLKRCEYITEDDISDIIFTGLDAHINEKDFFINFARIDSESDVYNLLKKFIETRITGLKSEDSINEAFNSYFESESSDFNNDVVIYYFEFLFAFLNKLNFDDYSTKYISNCFDQFQKHFSKLIDFINRSDFAEDDKETLKNYSVDVWTKLFDYKRESIGNIKDRDPAYLEHNINAIKALGNDELSKFAEFMKAYYRPFFMSQKFESTPNLIFTDQLDYLKSWSDCEDPFINLTFSILVFEELIASLNSHTIELDDSFFQYLKKIDDFFHVSDKKIEHNENDDLLDTYVDLVEKVVEKYALYGQSLLDEFIDQIMHCKGFIDENFLLIDFNLKDDTQLDSQLKSITTCITNLNCFVSNYESHFVYILDSIPLEEFPNLISVNLFNELYRQYNALNIFNTKSEVNSDWALDGPYKEYNEYNFHTELHENDTYNQYVESLTELHTKMTSLSSVIENPSSSSD